VDRSLPRLTMGFVNATAGVFTPALIEAYLQSTRPCLDDSMELLPLDGLVLYRVQLL
jgi:hypothetical protein